jgi:hypothetical protein
MMLRPLSYRKMTQLKHFHALWDGSARSKCCYLALRHSACGTYRASVAKRAGKPITNANAD